MTTYETGHTDISGFSKKVGMNLPVSMAVYVPSTRFDKKVSEKEFNARIKETEKMLSTFFGGATRLRGRGSYVEKEELIQEEVAVVECFATAAAWRKNKARLRRWLLKKQREWQQYSIGFELEGDMTLVRDA